MIDQKLDDKESEMLIKQSEGNCHETSDCRNDMRVLWRFSGNNFSGYNQVSGEHLSWTLLQSQQIR